MPKSDYVPCSSPKFIGAIGKDNWTYNGEITIGGIVYPFLVNEYHYKRRGVLNEFYYNHETRELIVPETYNELSE